MFIRRRGGKSPVGVVGRFGFHRRFASRGVLEGVGWRVVSHGLRTVARTWTLRCVDWEVGDDAASIGETPFAVYGYPDRCPRVPSATLLGFAVEPLRMIH